MNKKILFTILSMYWSFQLGFSQQQANYELAQKFYDFTLGGKLSHNSLSIYPREINDTDNFWFEFQTTVGKEYYYVMPAAGKREPLFDKGKMAMQLSEFTKGVVDKKINWTFHLLLFLKTNVRLCSIIRVNNIAIIA